MSPQVSYIMAAYNHEAHVGRMIESVIAQTHKDWELIILDDGSTDGTPTIIHHYAEREPRIRYQVQKNAGIVETRNRGAALAVGEYLSFIDSDDFLLPHRTEQLLLPFKGNPQCVLSYGDAWIESKDGNRVSFWSKHPVVSGQGPTPLFLGGCFIPALSVLVKREPFLASGPLWGGGASTDYLKWLDLSLIGDRECVTKEPLAVWRHHGKNLSQSVSDNRIRQYLTLAEDLQSFIEKAGQKGVAIAKSAVSTRLAHCYTMAGLYSIALGNIKSGRHYLFKGIKIRVSFKGGLGILLSQWPFSLVSSRWLKSLLARQ
jgi:glycosyltransferase involved in cell wall biosynthesis